VRAVATLVVKGTRYYKAHGLLSTGALVAGLPVRLEHQPDNPHDRNAVAIRVRSSGEMLGHVARELAPKYAVLANSKRIAEAVVSSVSMDGEYLRVRIRVDYEQSVAESGSGQKSRLWRSIVDLPAEPGVYAIRNVKNGRAYIGSSGSIKERLRTHFAELISGSHHNRVLQADFLRGGPGQFEAEVIAANVSTADLARVESETLSSLLRAGTPLYNLTRDGQGSRTYSKSNATSAISDRVDISVRIAEGSQVDPDVIRRRKLISNETDLRFKSIFPPRSLLPYFGVSSLCILWFLSENFPNMVMGVKLLVALPLGAFFGHCVRGYFIGQVKRSQE